MNHRQLSMNNSMVQYVYIFSAVEYWCIWLSGSVYSLAIIGACHRRTYNRKMSLLAILKGQISSSTRGKPMDVFNKRDVFTFDDLAKPATVR